MLTDKNQKKNITNVLDSLEDLLTKLDKCEDLAFKIDEKMKKVYGKPEGIWKRRAASKWKYHWGEKYENVFAIRFKCNLRGRK